jgi:hypothetical protein
MALVVVAWGIDPIELGSRILAQPLFNRTLSLGQCEQARTQSLGLELKLSLVFSTLELQWNHSWNKVCHSKL